MATKIVTKNSSTSGSAPLASDLVQGELAVNVTDKRLYTENASGTIVEVGTNPSTLTVTGEITANGGIALGDNDKATFGAGNDLQIYHDGSHSYVKDAGAGNLKLQGASYVLLESDEGNIMLRGQKNNALLLYYNGAIKLATTATGIDVTGNVVADGLTVDAGGTLRLDAASTTDFFTIAQGGTQAVLTADSPDGAGNIMFRTASAGVDSDRLKIDSNGDVSFYEDTGTTPKFFWDASAESLTVGGDDSTTATSLSTLVLGEYADASSGAVLRSSTASAINFEDSNASTAGRIYYNHTSDYMAFNTATSERMRIDSSGNVGIGESSPQRALHVNAGSTDIVALLQSDTNAYLSFWDSVGGVKLGSESGSMVFYEGSNSTGAGGAEAMRIDSSGNLLVGKTSTAVSSDGIEARNDGLLVVTRDSNKAAILNRRSSDGDILEFMKDSAAVGSIGSNSGTRAYLVLDPRTAYKGAGITGSSIDANTSNIIPTDKNGTIANGDINLGYASSRWKNLYLSGGVYLGGTGDANKLDDYEEGDVTGITCTGSTSGSATVIINNATYTKIGNVVNLYLYLTMDFSGDDIVGDIEITNLPFSNANNNLQNVSIIHQTISTTYLTLGARVTSNSLRVQTNSTSSGLARADCVNSANRVMMIGATYNTDA